MDRNLCYLVTFILAFGNGFGVELPSVACPDKFSYLKLDDRYVAQVSVVLNASSTQNTVKVELMTRGVSALKIVENIKLSDKESNVKEKVQKNEKINFQMDITKTDVLPKLRRIIVNGEIVCQDVPYDPPFSTAVRTLDFYLLPDQDKAEDKAV